ncbi:MAG: tetratricopeptide repeat protein [Longimicrobiaceae bacterium]
MSWWTNLLSGRSDGDSKPDYYEEGLDLLGRDQYHDALTSFRLALRERPDDLEALQQMAVVYTRIGMTDEAARTYRKVLDADPYSPGAHYGLAFLLIGGGKQDAAVAHLRAFLARPPRTAEATAHVEHARTTLTELTGEEA